MELSQGYGDNILDSVDKGRQSARLVSLLDMERFYARRLFELLDYLGKVTATLGLGLTTQGRNPDAKVSVDMRPIVRRMRAACRHAGLPVAAKAADWLPEEPTEGQVLSVLEDLRRRVWDESKAVLFMRIPEGKASYYTGRRLFGDAVDAGFPSARFDIAEAGKCLAAGRNTACVFHLMRVLETGLAALCTEVGVVSSEKNWQSLLDQIGRAIKEPKFDAKRAFYRAVTDRLGRVKDAWRNDTMHVRAKYDDEEAMESFLAVRAFMRRLVTEIRETPLLP